jgi:hypothetical protein
MFERERGVIILKQPERMHKRPYRSIRIPNLPVSELVGAVRNNDPELPERT